MRRNTVLFAFVLAFVACHDHREAVHHKPNSHKPPLIRFQPIVGRTYRYAFRIDAKMDVKDGDKNPGDYMKLEMVVNYQVEKDGGEFLLTMSFDSIHVYAKYGETTLDCDAPGNTDKSTPLGDILVAIKADSTYARVRLSDFTVTHNGDNVVDPIVARYSREADREIAATYWKQWVDHAIIWDALDPLVRVYPDSAGEVGDHWHVRRTSTEDIVFDVDNTFQLDSIMAGIASVTSKGTISNDVASTWVLDKKASGKLGGTEQGFYAIDTATGMPKKLVYAVYVAGQMKINSLPVVVKFSKSVRMAGGPVKR